MIRTVRAYRLPMILKKTIAERATSSIAIRENTGISEALVSNYIHGKNIPSAYNLLLLADYLGVSTDYLLTGEED